MFDSELTLPTVGSVVQYKEVKYIVKEVMDGDLALIGHSILDSKGHGYAWASPEDVSILHHPSDYSLRLLKECEDEFDEEE